MRIPLIFLAAVLSVFGMTGVALGIVVFLDAFPLGETAYALNLPGRGIEIFMGGLSMLGLGTSAGLVGTLLDHLQPYQKTLKEIEQNAPIS